MLEPFSLWLSGYSTDKPLFQHVLALTAARQTAMKANKDFLSTKVSDTDRTPIYQG
jgi:hypothetical protein